MKHRLVTFALLSALAACGSEPVTTAGAGRSPSTSPTTSPTSGSTAELGVADYEAVWELRSGHGPEGDIPLVPNYPITMEIKGRELYGTAACNGYGMKLEISGTSFDTRAGGMEQMGCTGKVQRSESTFIAALLAADTIVRDGDSITLTGPDTLLKFDELQPPQVAKLVGTRWKLQTLLFGSDPDSTASSPVEPAFLELRKDGSLEGHTGCAPISGEWISSAGQINFVEFSTEPPCPPRLDEQHGTQISVLGDGFRAKVEGDTLTITSAHGTDGLVYRAD